MPPAWIEDVVYLLACLQRCGARLNAASASTGRTAKDELLDLLEPRPADHDNGMASNTASREGDEVARYLRQVIRPRPGGNGDGHQATGGEEPRMVFHRPRIVFPGPPGDDIIQQLLRDKLLWW
ncbi:uncharacterized protein PG986_014268 [Apiospora aurea]|uniref:Uncharacterized protein n=1 Tax=Apiospora aurea TaxID=335848 RepID=A0ABR1PSH3_9PEZI